MMKMGIGKQNKWHGTALERSSSAPTTAYQRKHDGSAKRKCEFDFATATDSPFLGLPGRMCCVHSVLYLRYSKFG